MAIVVTEARSFSAGSRREPLEDSSQPNCLPSPDSVGQRASEDTCCGQPLRSFRADDGRYISVCMRCGTETTHKDMAHYGGSPWIGVDLDGTLAKDGFDADNPDRIGEPVGPMMERLRQWLSEGKSVKIFTARASVPRQVALVKQWLKEQKLPDLEVTNAKDFKMVELWDDRAIRVDRNSGEPTAYSGLPDAQETKLSIRARRRSGASLFTKLRVFLAL